MLSNRRNMLRRSTVPCWQQSWRLLCLIWCWLFSGSVWAQDHITQRAWVEDTAGQWSWSQASKQPTHPYEGVLSQGFGSGIIWLRLHIDPQAHTRPARQAQELVLRIRPVYLDEIQVFDPLAPGGLAGVTGDHQHPRDDAYEGLDFLLPIARGDAPRDIWLRLKSTSTRQIAVQALSPDDLQRSTQTQQLLYALYIGVILIFMVWGLVYWVFSRELVIGAFGIKQAAALVYALSSLGYTRVYWPADWPARWLDMTTTLFSILAVSTAIYFHTILIREFKPPRWATWGFRTMLALLPIKLLMMLLNEDMTLMALRINMLEVLLAPPVFLASVLLARGWTTAPESQRPILSRWVAVGFYALLVMILLVASLPGLGLSKGGEIPLYVVQAHGLLTAFLILLMLQYRAHVQQKQQRDTALALERSQLQTMQEREVREEQEKLLTMLAHELKTPLAIMQMRLDPSAPGSRDIRYAIRDMNAVIERCVQTIQLGDRQLQARMATVDLSSVISDAVSTCSQPERVQTELPGRLTAHTDRQLIFIALSNLLENACKYASPSTPIHVKLKADPVQACVEVSNRPGQAGWPAADKVFEKYYRSPHARRQAGTGLGLFLVRNLMQVLGGHIAYLPNEEEVRFVICLPLATSVN